MSSAASTVFGPKMVSRWWQLLAAVIAMMAIANLQYAWTLFTTPLTKTLGASLAAVQVAFAAFILVETWLVPFEGALVDRFGPRIIIMSGAVLVAAGWVGAGMAQSLTELYAYYTIGGVGAGAVYGACMGHALKWFPDHRGLCAGVTAGAYGIGTALTVAPIESMIKTAGYAHTFVVWGIIQGVVVLVAGFFIVRPPEGWSPPGWVKHGAATSPRVNRSPVDLAPMQMIRHSSFWVLYFMMTLMAFSGLVITAQVNPIAKFYHVDQVVVAFGMSALVLAIQIERILNGVTRPFWGWVSDHIGRENTMFIAFGLQSVTIVLLLQLIHRPIWFIVLSGLAFFSWGEIFSLFPAATADLFGQRYATTNYGIVYTAKGLASIFSGPVAALAAGAAASWVPVFWAMVVCSGIDAILALVLLKPLARRTIERATRAFVADTALRANPGLAESARSAR
ncbi:MAG TPA: oxalate/formate MFS antiporter [Candidatus Bathyarchaeia archaeon]|nr:oxalate/formate MFS antiporter [Candidatus Bathyarchaeia archaeon]